jgi:hypothetical protein
MRRPASDDDPVRCITALSIISMGVTNARRLTLPEDVAARNVKCFGSACQNATFADWRRSKQ